MLLVQNIHRDTEVFTLVLKRRVTTSFELERDRGLERIARMKGQSVAALVLRAVEEEYLQPELARGNSYEGCNR